MSRRVAKPTKIRPKKPPRVREGAGTILAAEPPDLPQETANLLRQRLRIAMIILAVALVIGLLRGLMVHGIALVLLRVVVLALIGGGIGLLFSRVSLSLLQLRAVELVAFGAIGLQCVLTAIEEALYFSAQGDIASTVSVHDFNILAWTMLILIYGIFVPNTWQRAMAVLLPAAVIPILVSVWMHLLHEPTSRILADDRFDVGFSGPLLAAAAAIVAAHWVDVTRRREFRARRFGSYLLQERLSGGGMGEVFRAEHMMLKRPCAIKVIRPDHRGNEQLHTRFEREVKATAALTHWHTIEIYDYGQTDDGLLYYVMELLEGMNLQEIVTIYGPLPPARVIHFMRQTCSALREAHQQDLVHRDIKPANIFASRLGGEHDVTKLLDFGLVKVATTSADPQLTAIGAVVGTSLYMAPEQAMMSHYATAKSDLYSLGAVGYYLLTGEPPFDGDDPAEVLAAHASDPVKPPSEMRSGVPSDLEAVLLRCLEKKPDDRYEDAASLNRALSECADGDAWDADAAAQWWDDVDHSRLPLSIGN